MDLSRLRDVCNSYRGCAAEYYLDPIPEHKAKFARKSLGIPQTAQIAALIDFTVFGSAEESMVVTDLGVYWRNKQDKASLSFAWPALLDFTPKETVGSWTKHIELDGGLKIDLAGAPTLIKKENQSVLLLLNELKAIEQSQQTEVRFGEDLDVSNDGLFACEFCMKMNKPEVTFCKNCGIKLRG